MLFDLVIAILGLAVIPFGLAVIEFWLWGGEIGPDPPAIDSWPFHRVPPSYPSKAG